MTSVWAPQGLRHRQIKGPPWQRDRNQECSSSILSSNPPPALPCCTALYAVLYHASTGQEPSPLALLSAVRAITFA